MTRIPRTPVENPFCSNQKSTDEPIQAVMDYPTLGVRKGWCPRCDRLVNLRKNSTAKLHRVYGRREMARLVAAYKRGEY